MEASPQYPLDTFVYKYLAGPVETAAEIEAGVPEGNCRFALQLYFYRMHGIFLKRDEIYLPGGYKTLGRFVFEEAPVNLDDLLPGDILYAQIIRDKEGRAVDKSLEQYRDKDVWLYYLHSAIYLGALDDGPNRYVWHSTLIDAGPTLWSFEKFGYYYKPISAKRVLHSKRDL
jgi:hypothetical protein